LVLAAVMLLVFTLYQTPTMAFFLEGFRLCGCQ
jgi:hypothetical protein